MAILRVDGIPANIDSAWVLVDRIIRMLSKLCLKP
jgi:hypothetical protein